MIKKTAKIIDGRALADKILSDLSRKISTMEKRPGLADILIGDDPASKLYVNNKKKAAQKIGINFYDYLAGGQLMPAITQEQILEMIDFLNADPDIDGIIVQLPLPKGYDTETIIKRVDPKKDVDGFRSKNLGHQPGEALAVTPPLIAAIIAAIQSTGETVSGKYAVIVAKNPIVSEPIKNALLNLGLAVTLAQPDDQLAIETNKADVLIVIVGRAGLIKKSMVKPNAMVIDVGTNFVGDNTWVGDVEPAVREIAGWITPVPGGIGPLNTAMLLKGTYDLAKQHGK